MIKQNNKGRNKVKTYQLFIFENSSFNIRDKLWWKNRKWSAWETFVQRSLPTHEQIVTYPFLRGAGVRLWYRRNTTSFITQPSIVSLPMSRKTPTRPNPPILIFFSLITYHNLRKIFQSLWDRSVLIDFGMEYWWEDHMVSKGNGAGISRHQQGIKRKLIYRFSQA